MGALSSPELLTIPPEILLTIISHLPTKTFLPLIQTCRGLKTFFSSNAATICNTHIVKYHALEASILDSAFVRGEDGQSWLVPTHSMVLPSQHAVFEDTQLRVSANQSSSARLISPSQKACHMTDAELRLREKMRFGVPGPLYLSFLETMGWDLRMRLVMVRRKSIYGRYLDEFQVMPRDDDPELDAEEAEHVEYFAWAVERYITRAFWLRCSRFIDGFMAREEDEGQSGMAITLLSGVRHKRGLLKNLFGNVLVPKHDAVKTRGLLFGEVEKVDGHSSKSDTENVAFAKSLLWYYGRSGVLGFQDQKVDTKPKTGKLRKYVCNVKVTIAKVNNITARASTSERFKRTKDLIRNALRRYRCAGGFERLD